MSQQEFQKALKKLVDEANYRQQVQSDPQRLTNDFQLTGGELGILMAVGQAAAGQLVSAGAGATAANCSSSVACCCCCP